VPLSGGHKIIQLWTRAATSCCLVKFLFGLKCSFTSTNRGPLSSVRIIFIIILLFLALAEVRAAKIDVRYLEGGSARVVIEGDLEIGDIETFQRKAGPIPATRATVEFLSKGGSLLAGIRVGAQIRAKKFATLVPDGTQCASACALAWLGGARRYVGEYSSVGFHTAYIIKAAGPTESGPGNAILGAYLNQLGLSEKAILYITHAAPTSMQWMSIEEAAEYGITVASSPPSHSTMRFNSSGAAITEHPVGSSERRAIDFVLSLIERWSGSNGEILPLLDGLYTDTVLYHGKSTPRQSVLLNKQRFANRWSQRTYHVLPNSISATCAKSGETCRVKGTMGWKFHDAKANSTSRDVAKFEYGVVLNGESPQIAVETSFTNERPSFASSSLEQVKQSVQQLLAQLAKSGPAKALMRAESRPKATVAR
jgi:hypothetical protein